VSRFEQPRDHDGSRRERATQIRAPGAFDQPPAQCRRGRIYKGDGIVSTLLIIVLVLLLLGGGGGYYGYRSYGNAGFGGALGLVVVVLVVLWFMGVFTGLPIHS
jgi:uncharacterized protein DUF3309